MPTTITPAHKEQFLASTNLGRSDYWGCRITLLEWRGRLEAETPAASCPLESDSG